jgi:hypothetical protein
MMGWRRIEGECWVGEDWNQKCQLIYSTHLFNSFMQRWSFQISRVTDPGKLETGRVTDPARNAGSLTLRFW